MYISLGSTEAKDPSISDKTDSKCAEKKHKKRANAASVVTNVAGVAAGKAQQSREGSEPQSNMKTQRHHKVGLPWSCNELGCNKAYATPAQLASHYEKDHPSQGPNHPLPCGKGAHNIIQKIPFSARAITSRKKD